MLSALVAIVLLVASVGAIYLLLKSMGQEGVEIAAPGSCKSGTCGVRKIAGASAGCREEEARSGEPGEIGDEAAPGHDDTVAQPTEHRLS